MHESLKFTTTTDVPISIRFRIYPEDDDRMRQNNDDGWIYFRLYTYLDIRY